MTEETPLLGGNITVGLVRVGSTVRRPRLPSSPFVEQLLHGLEAAGFTAAPRHLGVDDQNRDILSFIPGEVEPDWRRDAELVCHGDPGPHNSIFQDGLPVALIDFDMATPGPALADVCYAAWGWCLSSNEERGSAEEQAHQLRLFADGYGLEEPQRLVGGIIERQIWSAGWWRDHPELETADASPEGIDWNLKERDHVEKHRGIFLSALA